MFKKFYENQRKNQTLFEDNNNYVPFEFGKHKY